MEKKCYICDTVKNIEDFYKNQTRCKLCTKEYTLKNNKRIKSYKKQYRIDNKEKLKESDRKYYLENIERLNAQNNEYYHNNKEIIKENQKKYREDNKDDLSIRNREYTKRYKERKSSDNLWKLSSSIRSSIGNSFRLKGLSKNKRTEEILGCTFEEFKLHLESKFENWMSWENKGLFNGDIEHGWDIDHIIPLSTAITEDEIVKLNHYTNLQPLCSYTNRHIKMDNTNFYTQEISDR